MIVCGWCRSTTEPGRCSTCGRDPALPWLHRNVEPPRAGRAVSEAHGGRPRLNPNQIRHKVRIARKDHPNVTKAELAEVLGIDLRTLTRWEKVSA